MLLIKNGKILTMAGVDYDKGCILIDGKKIIKVGEYIDEDNSDISKVIDASNCIVMPGIIEAHSHIGI